MTLGLTGCHKCPYLHLERLFLCQPTLIDTLQQDQMLRQLLNSLALSSASSKNRIFWVQQALEATPRESPGCRPRFQRRMAVPVSGIVGPRHAKLEPSS